MNAKLLPLSSTHFEEIDVCKALTAPGRLLYPKIARVSKLDELLARRVQLKVNEEKACSLKAKEVTGLVNNADGTNKDNKTDASSGKAELLKGVAEKIQKLRMQYAVLNRLAKPYKCYSAGCNAAFTGQHSSVVSNCYSPLCIQKLNLRRELLQLLRSAHNSANNINAVKKPSILEQKLSESRVVENKEKDPVNITNDLLNAYNSAIIFNADLISCCAINATIVKDEVMDIEEKQIIADSHTAQVPNTKLKLEIVTDDKKVTIDKYSSTLQNISPQDIKVEANYNFEKESNMDIMTPEAINEMILGGGSIKSINESNSKDEQAIRNGKSKYHTRGRPAKQVITTTQVTTTTTTVTKTMRIVDGVVQSVEGVTSQNIHSTKEKNFQSATLSASSQYHAQMNRRFCANKSTKREEVNLESEFAEDGSKKIYSAFNTAGKIYLKNNSNLNGKKKKMQQIKYPVVASFRTKNKNKTIMALPQHELKTLARHAGRLPVNGYHHLAKVK